MYRTSLSWKCWSFHGLQSGECWEKSWPRHIPHICHFFYTDRTFKNQILHPKKRLKAPKTLKMSLKKSNICIFFTQSGKIYTWQKIFTQTCLWCLWQISGMQWPVVVTFVISGLEDCRLPLHLLSGGKSWSQIVWPANCKLEENQNFEIQGGWTSSLHLTGKQGNWLNFFASNTKRSRSSAMVLGGLDFDGN